MNSMLNTIEASEARIGIEWFYALQVFDLLCSDFEIESPSRSLPRVSASFILAMKRNGKSWIVDSLFKELEQHLFSNNVTVDSAQMIQTIRKEEDYLCTIDATPTILCWIDAILSRFDAFSVGVLSRDVFERSHLISWASLCVQRLPVSGERHPKKIAMGVCAIALVFMGVVPASCLRPAHIEQSLWRDAFAAVWGATFARVRPIRNMSVKSESFVLLLQHASMSTLLDLQTSTSIVIDVLRKVLTPLHFI